MKHQATNSYKGILSPCVRPSPFYYEIQQEHWIWNYICLREKQVFQSRHPYIKFGIGLHFVNHCLGETSNLIH